MNIIALVFVLMHDAFDFSIVNVDIVYEPPQVYNLYNNEKNKMCDIIILCSVHYYTNLFLNNKL